MLHLRLLRLERLDALILARVVGDGDLVEAEGKGVSGWVVVGEGIRGRRNGVREQEYGAEGGGEGGAERGYMRGEVRGEEE